MVLLAALQGVVCASRADVYRWIDEDGTVHYGERWRAPRDAGRLDIPLQGNDPPEAALTCQTIPCQYERLRSDGERLRRNQREADTAWEKELADRERQAARQRAAEDRDRADTAQRSSQWMLPRRVIPRPAAGNRRPTEPPVPAVDPGSRLRTPAPGASPVKPLR
jgi:hypothetical protein